MINFKAKTPDGEIIKSALSHMTFPAGEAHTKREERRELEPTEIAILQPSPDSLHTDLFQLAMWNNYLVHEIQMNHEKVQRVLVLPYMPGARADRGNPFGLKVYADFIEQLFLNKIIVFDPHSGATGDELHAAADNLEIVYSDELLGKSYIKEQLGHYDGVIAPDAGAQSRAFKVSTVLDTSFYQAEKTRDFETGKLSGFKLDGLPKDGKYLIVDDICDGGGTFLGLAEAIGLPKEQLDLYVSHGVFSKNAHFNLSKKFGHVITTNSFIPESTPTDLLFKRGANTIQRAAKFTHLDVIHLLLERI